MEERSVRGQGAVEASLRDSSKCTGALQSYVVTNSDARACKGDLSRLKYLAGRLPSTGRKEKQVTVLHTDTQKATRIRELMQLTLGVCSFSLRTGPRRKPSANSDPPRPLDTQDTDRKNRKRI